MARRSWVWLCWVASEPQGSGCLRLYSTGLVSMIMIHITFYINVVSRDQKCPQPKLEHLSTPYKLGEHQFIQFDLHKKGGFIYRDVHCNSSPSLEKDGSRDNPGQAASQWPDCWLLTVSIIASL